MTAEDSDAQVGLPPISEVAASARANVDTRVEAMMAAVETEAGAEAELVTTAKPKAGHGWRRSVFLDELRNLPVFGLGVGMFAFAIIGLWAYKSASPRGVIIDNQCLTPVEVRYIPESAGDTGSGHETTVLEAGQTLELEPLLVLDFPHFSRALGYDEEARSQNILIVLSPGGNNCPTAPTPVESD